MFGQVLQKLGYFLFYHMVTLFPSKFAKSYFCAQNQFEKRFSSSFFWKNCFDARKFFLKIFWRRRRRWCQWGEPIFSKSTTFRTNTRTIFAYSAALLPVAVERLYLVGGLHVVGRAPWALMALVKVIDRGFNNKINIFCTTIIWYFKY